MSTRCRHLVDVQDCQPCNEEVVWRGTMRGIAHASHQRAFEGARALCGTSEARILAADGSIARCPACLDALASLTSLMHLVSGRHIPIRSLSDRLRTKSELGELGYSVKLDRDHRWRLLRVAVDAYGVAYVINLLDGNVQLRLTQRNGAMQYAYAIREWHHDIARLRQEYVK